VTSRLPSRSSRSQLSELRRLLRSEASTLLNELERLSKKQREVLQGLVRASERADDTTLMSEAKTLRESVESARRVLARLSAAEQSTEKLKAEWHDWECHSAYVDDAEHVTKKERQEIIASELRLRGVRIPSNSSQSISIHEAPCVSVPEAPCLSQVNDAENEPIIEVALELETPALDEQSILYWDALVSSLPPESIDERSLSRLLGAYRQIQGEQKRADRRKGTRRYRLGAFEAWS